MPSQFERQTVIIKQDNSGLDPVTKNFAGGYQTIAEGIKCRITGTHADNIKLFINKRNYDKIPGGIKKDYKIIVDGVDQVYRVTRVPIETAGVTHHYEFFVEESN